MSTSDGTPTRAPAATPDSTRSAPPGDPARYGGTHASSVSSSVMAYMSSGISGSLTSVTDGDAKAAMEKLKLARKTFYRQTLMLSLTT